MKPQVSHKQAVDHSKREGNHSTLKDRKTERSNSFFVARNEVFAFLFVPKGKEQYARNREYQKKKKEH